MSTSERESNQKNTASEKNLDNTTSKEIDIFSPVICEVVASETDKMQRLKLVTQEYIGRKYISEKDDLVIKKGGIYVDEYESSACSFIAKVDSKVIASLRLIPNQVLGLPINNEEKVKNAVFPEWREIIKNAKYEWSQLAKLRNQDSRSVLGLMRTAIAYSRENGCNEGIAAMDDNVCKILNGPFMRFNVSKIGDSILYMGSQSTPIHFNFDQAIKNSYDGGLHGLSKFLDTGKAEGFEWYRGK